LLRKGERGVRREATNKSVERERRMGPPVANKNAFKTGWRSAAAVERRREVAALLRSCRELPRESD
jgi:hypothetical protein